MEHYKIYFFFIIDKEIINFGDNEIEKLKFHHYKNQILLEYINIQISSMDSFGEKKILLVTNMIIIKLKHHT